jgi:hypothetical protein
MMCDHPIMCDHLLYHLQELLTAYFLSLRSACPAAAALAKDVLKHAVSQWKYTRSFAGVLDLQTQSVTRQTLDCNAMLWPGNHLMAHAMRITPVYDKLAWLLPASRTVFQVSIAGGYARLMLRSTILPAPDCTVGAALLTSISLSFMPPACIQRPCCTSLQPVTLVSVAYALHQPWQLRCHSLLQYLSDSM